MNTETSAPTDCPICLDILTEPKVIPCGHVMCRSCLVTWLEVRETAAECPLCRCAILAAKEMPDGTQFRQLAEQVADAFPTHLVVKATARGRHVTAETCLGCQDLLCTSHDTPHVLCPGPQDAQQTLQRELEARATFKMLSQKLRKMVEQMAVIQAFLKRKTDEFIGLVPDTLNYMILQAQALLFVARLQQQAGQLSTILLTHQHLMERLQDSPFVIAIILMRDAMELRVKILESKMENCVYESVLWAFL